MSIRTLMLFPMITSFNYRMTILNDLWSSFETINRVIQGLLQENTKKGLKVMVTLLGKLNKLFY